MEAMRKPIKKVRASTSGIAYTGIGTLWNCSFGTVIVVAENEEALATACLRMEERKEHQVFDPEACKEVAVFNLADLEVA